MLGLFTAIRRLRAVHGRIADRLAREGLPLYAQHVDPIDTGTLVDIFRDDPRASLLGTDALRDGVDVPGHSLRCVVMEQVPWPKPSILHRARRAANGGSSFDDRIIRARLAQAFGQLIRTAEDRGHFMVLSGRLPQPPDSRPSPGHAHTQGYAGSGFTTRRPRCFWEGRRDPGRSGLAAGGMDPVKLLGLLRHAKSDWDDLGLRDFDRGLNDRGRRGAALMGEHIREHGVKWGSGRQPGRAR